MVDDSGEIEIFDPVAVWKKKKLTNIVAKKMLVPIFEKGRCVYTSPSLDAIKAYCADQLEHLWDEVKRFDNPHRYYVDLSPRLWEIKNRLLADHNEL